jgi:hypothetical protein
LTIGLDETVGVLEATGDELFRVGSIRTADRVWTFMLFLNATATTVMACADAARTSRDSD